MGSLECVAQSPMTYKPFDRVGMHKRGIRHHFHPGLHVFGCVRAKVVCSHVGMCRLHDKISERDNWEFENAALTRLEQQIC